MQPHTTKINGHRFTIFAKADSPTFDPPGQYCQDVMDCTTSLLEQDLRKKGSLVFCEGQKQVIEFKLSALPRKWSILTRALRIGAVRTRLSD